MECIVQIYCMCLTPHMHIPSPSYRHLKSDCILVKNDLLGGGH